MPLGPNWERVHDFLNNRIAAALLAHGLAFPFVPDQYDAVLRVAFRSVQAALLEVDQPLRLERVALSSAGELYFQIGGP